MDNAQLLAFTLSFHRLIGNGITKNRFFKTMENLQVQNILRFMVAIILAGVVANFIHTYVGIGVPTYNTFIETISYLTKPEEALGVAIIYYFIGDRLPTQSRLLKGILLGLIILLAKGQLIRQLLMNLLLPNTLKEALLFQSQAWLSNLAMAIIIALIINPKYNIKSKTSYNTVSP